MQFGDRHQNFSSSVYTKHDVMFLLRCSRSIFPVKNCTMTLDNRFFMLTAINLRSILVRINPFLFQIRYIYYDNAKKRTTCKPLASCLWLLFGPKNMRARRSLCQTQPLPGVYCRLSSIVIIYSMASQNTKIAHTFFAM